MKTAYIFHDSFADQYADWYPWLKQTLKGFGYNTIVPAFPTPAGQALASWRAVMRNFIPTFDEETIFIGHGTGAVFALRMLEESAKQIHGLFVVAGYAEKIGHAGFDRVNETFLTGDFKWETIQMRAMMIRAFAGSNDPYVPMVASERLAKNLGVTLEILPDAGHITKASGYAQFIVLADAIREGQGMIGKGVQAEVESQQSEDIIAKIQDTKNKTRTETGAADTGLSTASSAMAKDLKNSSAPEAVPATPSSIHTMYQDMGTLVNSNQGSVASSLLSKARQDETEKREASPTSPKNILYFFGTLIIVLMAIGIVGYVFQKYLPAKKNQVARDVPSIIRAETHQNIAIDNKQPYAVIEQVRAALATNPLAGTIRDIYYTHGSAFASFPQVMTAMDITTVPQNLVTEFQPSFMHGTAMIGGKPAHFLVLPVKNYDTAFAGLRDWEQTMFRSLGVFMNVPDAYLRTKTDSDVFADEMIANRNLRVLRYVKPVDIHLDEPPVAPPVSTEPKTVATTSGNDTASLQREDSATTVPIAADATNFISEGLQMIQNNNPFANVTAPYQEGDIMLAYFFLTERTVVIVDNPDIIPEILARFANRQIYE